MHWLLSIINRFVYDVCTGCMCLLIIDLTENTIYSFKKMDAPFCQICSFISHWNSQAQRSSLLCKKTFLTIDKSMFTNHINSFFSYFPLICGYRLYTITDTKQLTIVPFLLTGTFFPHFKSAIILIFQKGVQMGKAENSSNTQHFSKAFLLLPNTYFYIESPHTNWENFSKVLSTSTLQIFLQMTHAAC